MKSFTVKKNPAVKKRLVKYMVVSGQPVHIFSDEDKWNSLSLSIKAILWKQPVILLKRNEFSKLFKHFCEKKMGQSLYQMIEKECETYLAAAFQSVVDKSKDLDLVGFLSVAEKGWKDFCASMELIKEKTRYLHIFYVNPTPNVQTIWMMSMQLFHKQLSLASLDSKTVSGVLELFERERLGEKFDRSVIKHLLEMFTELGIYDKFEEPFLIHTLEFYVGEGLKYTPDTELSDYLKLVQTRLYEEEQRFVLYGKSTREISLSIAQEQMLGRHITAMLDKDFVTLVDGKCIEDLKRMYMLFSKVNAYHEALNQSLHQYLQKTSQSFVRDREKDQDLVCSIVQFKVRLDRIWDESFARDAAFCRTIDKAFLHLINQLNLPPELIATFVDGKLRAANKCTTEEELEGVLDEILVLYKTIEDQDVFEAFYMENLAKRLLLGKSASNDVEMSMISKFKNAGRGVFAYTLERMLKDAQLSTKYKESFKQYQEQMTFKHGIDMSPHVLNSNYWPKFPSTEVKLPQELTHIQECFEKFYLDEHKGTKLMLQSTLSSCVVEVQFPKGKKELTASLLQTAVLMLFNDAEILYFQDIKDSTGIKDTLLKATLQSLSCEKCHILTKTPKGEDVDDQDSFTVNNHFTTSQYRVKVNEIKRAGTEKKSIILRAYTDRKDQVDAAIVRTMKARKVLTHKMLFDEVFKQLNFTITSTEFKICIEQLIDRGMMERDTGDAQKYNFCP